MGRSTLMLYFLFNCVIYDGHHLLSSQTKYQILNLAKKKNPYFLFFFLAFFPIS